MNLCIIETESKFMAQEEICVWKAHSHMQEMQKQYKQIMGCLWRNKHLNQMNKTFKLYTSKVVTY